MQKKKGIQGIIEIENPNLVKPKTLKARDIDVSFANFFELSSDSEFYVEVIFGLFIYVFLTDWKNN